MLYRHLCTFLFEFEGGDGGGRFASEWVEARPYLSSFSSPSSSCCSCSSSSSRKSKTFFFAVHKIFIRIILFSLLLLLQISANLRMWSRTPPGKERKNREEDSSGLTPVPRPLNCRRRCRHYCRSSAVQPSRLPSRWRSPSTRTTGRGRTQKQLITFFKPFALQGTNLSFARYVMYHTYKATGVIFDFFCCITLQFWETNCCLPGRFFRTLLLVTPLQLQHNLRSLSLS